MLERSNRFFEYSRCGTRLATRAHHQSSHRQPLPLSFQPSYYLPFFISDFLLSTILHSTRSLIMSLWKWNSVQDRLLFMMALGVICIAGASFGLFGFAQAEWFTQTVFPTGWAGYTKANYTALLFFTFLAPIGFAFLFTSFQYLLRMAASRTTAVHILTLFVVVGILSTGMIFGLYWATDFLQCMGIACVNDNEYRPYDPKRPEAIMGFQNATGVKKMSLFHPPVLPPNTYTVMNSEREIEREREYIYMCVCLCVCVTHTIYIYAYTLFFSFFFSLSCAMLLL